MPHRWRVRSAVLRRDRARRNAQRCQRNRRLTIRATLRARSALRCKRLIQSLDLRQNEVRSALRRPHRAAPARHFPVRRRLGPHRLDRAHPVHSRRMRCTGRLPPVRDKIDNARVRDSKWTTQTTRARLNFWLHYQMFNHVRLVYWNTLLRDRTLIGDPSCRPGNS